MSESTILTTDGTRRATEHQARASREIPIGIERTTWPAATGNEQIPELSWNPGDEPVEDPISTMPDSVPAILWRWRHGAGAEHARFLQRKAPCRRREGLQRPSCFKAGPMKAVEFGSGTDLHKVVTHIHVTLLRLK
jgi:hypothetical protein